MLHRHAQVVCELVAATAGRYWDLAPTERKRVLLELSNLRAATDWTMASAHSRTLAYELLGKCWHVWMLSGPDEGVRRMTLLWPLPSNLPAGIEADFCVGFARLNKNAAGKEHWDAARRAEVLYRQLVDVEGLSLALLLVASIGAVSSRLSAAEQALREAEQLIADTGEVSKLGPLAATQGEFHLRRGKPRLAIAAFQRQAALCRRAGDELKESIALGNLGCAQLDAGDVDAAIESLRRSVDALRRIHAPYGLEFRLSTLAVALAWRGDDVDVLPLARESFDNLRLSGVTFAPLMAAALGHARRDALQRAVLLTGYAYSKLVQERHTRLIALPMQQWVRDRAMAVHPAARVEAWQRAGERLTEEQAAAIAFDEAPLDGCFRESADTGRAAADLELPTQ
jgi:tetratricopeptide (TPR) repeat protein